MENVPLPILTRSSKGKLMVKESNASRSHEPSTKKKAPSAPSAPVINLHEVLNQLESVPDGLNAVNTSLSSIFIQLEDLKEQVSNLSRNQKNHMIHDDKKIDRVCQEINCWFVVILTFIIVICGLSIMNMLFSGQFIRI